MKLQAKLVNELALLSPEDNRYWSDIAAILLRCCGVAANTSSPPPPQTPTPVRSQNPDKLLHDIALQSLRNAAVAAKTRAASAAGPSSADEPVKIVLDAILQCLQSLTAELMRSQDFDAITLRTLPCLSGLLRAFEEACVPLPFPLLDNLLTATHTLLAYPQSSAAAQVADDSLAPATPQSLSPRSSTPFLDRISDVLTAINSREELAPFKRRLGKYWEGAAFSSDIVVYRTLRVLRNIVTHVLMSLRPDMAHAALQAPHAGLHDDAAAAAAAALETASSLESPQHGQLPDFGLLWKHICEKDVFVAQDDVDRLNAAPTAFLTEVGDVALKYITEKKEILVNAWAVIPQGTTPEQDDVIKSSVAISIACYHIATVVALVLSHPPDTLLARLSHVLESVPLTSSPVFLKLHIAATDCLGLLAQKYTSMRPHIQKVLSEYLLAPSKVFALAAEFEHSTHSRLRRSAAISLAKTLPRYEHPRPGVALQQQEHSRTGKSRSGSPPPPPQLLYAAINTVQRREPNRTHAHFIFENGVAIISAIACHLNTPEVVDIAVSSVVRLLSPSTSPSQTTQILRALTDISLFSNERTFDETILLFAELAKTATPSMPSADSEAAGAALAKSNATQSNRLARAIVDCVERLARFAPVEYRRKILLALLGIFVDRASTIQQISSVYSKDKDAHDRDELSSLMEVLGAIMKLISRIGNAYPAKDITPEHVKLFRNFWFFVVLFEFTSSPSSVSFMDKYNEHVVEAALHTPVLFTNDSTRYLESDLVSESVVKSRFAEQNLARFREKLQKIVPQLYEVQALSFAETMFVLSVYNVEYHRSSECAIEFLKYMAVEEATPQQRTLSLVLEALLEKVFVKFLRDPNMREQRYHQVLESLCMEVLSSTVHIHPRVSRIALAMLPRILTQFPYMQYSRPVLYRALDLISVLERATSGYLNDDYELTYEFEIGDGTVLVLSDSMENRKRMLRSLRELSAKWMRLARERSSAQVVSLLQSYIIERRLPSERRDRRQGVVFALTVLSEIEREEGRQATLSSFVVGLSARSHYSGQLEGLSHWMPRLSQDSISQAELDATLVRKFKADAAIFIHGLRSGTVQPSEQEYNDMMYRTMAVLTHGQVLDAELTRVLVWAPIYVFTLEAVSLATELWSSLLQRFPGGELRVLLELSRAWQHLIRHEHGVFNLAWTADEPFSLKMKYSAERVSFEGAAAIKSAMACIDVLVGFLSSRWESVRGKNRECVNAIIDMMFNACNARRLSTHPTARGTRFTLLALALRISSKTVIEDEVLSFALRERVYNTALHWFTLTPMWSSSRSKELAAEEIGVLLAFWGALQQDKGWRGSTGVLHASGVAGSSITPNGTTIDLTADTDPGAAVNDNLKAHIADVAKRRDLLLLLLANEISRLIVWSEPTNADNITSPVLDEILQSANSNHPVLAWKQYVRTAWEVSPAIAVNMGKRFNNDAIQSELRLLVVARAQDAAPFADAVRYLLTEDNIARDIPELTRLSHWAPVPPITAITLFQPHYRSHPAVLQYAMRSLFSFDIDNVFFYIPQLVQALRHDPLGYVEEFILRAAKTSQVFAHQIIWNMNANMYKDEDGTDPDTLKPVFDRIIDKVVNSLSGDDQAFYEREFSFFNKVTSISGKLKPYIKRPKPEKKKKIDEELRQIQVDVGVYLPSNPESTVVDIDYDSGRPLQSHAKAPFMAKFKIRRQRPDDETRTEEVWQAAIFKVGDDCRQDLLALQLIAIFKNIYAELGLDLYLFPYRVVATAPGCGVIEVIPKSISRDEMGREKINSLYDYFVYKYGPPTQPSHQRARTSFLQSLAAYSVILYLLQIKDRHNGNIMIDDAGHIVHIDFGFILDISPGGINFESSPFKLTTEMIQVMGGGAGTEPFARFCELVVKAYLAVRPYVDEMAAVVGLMASSGLPCFFKNEQATVKRLRARFCAEKTERDAAAFMMDRINESYENRRTVLYDEFQRQTNGIPH
ncbi:phosphatidylinositol-4- kinase [Sorochytrium milnesiophthora]